MRVLGISAYYHDSAACLLVDGEVISAAQEERFSRIKHDSRFPRQAITYCLEQAGLDPADIDHIVFYDKPFLKFERLLETYLAFAPRGFYSFLTALPVWIKEKLFQKSLLAKEFEELLGKDRNWKGLLLFSEHHFSHAASAFYPSPFESAAVLTMDGVGEWSTTSLAVGRGNDLKIIKEIQFPHSIGLLYSAFTYYLGFRVNSGEYKVMGLAPYGEPRYLEEIRTHLVDIKPDGSFRLNMDYFNYCTGLTMTNRKFDKLFGGRPRKPESPLTQREMDLAASVQAITEEIVLKLARGVAAETGLKNLCLAGGVALNCVANGKLAKEGIFDNIWIQPAAGDAGGALGAALAAFHIKLGGHRPKTGGRDAMRGSLLGPEFRDEEVEEELIRCGAVFERLSEEEVIRRTAHSLAEGKAVGWMRGRMEFGPRALGNRSILADPRNAEMQKHLNLKVKFRESFRPFAPSILSEDVADWFEWESDSPYMLFVSEVLESRRKAIAEEEHSLFGIEKLGVQRSDIAAVTHVDFSARIQTVHEDTNPGFYNLLRRFKEITGCPVLINTSFNVRGEPIVCSPEDAFNCFMGTDLDVLVIENFILHKSSQPPALITNYKNRYRPD